MPELQNFSPEILKNRHRLTAQQINSILGENTIEESIEEKIVAFSQVKEFISVTDAFTAADIKFIPLKGALLSQRLYGDPTFRKYCDFDILTEVSAISKAIGIVLQLGYKANPSAWPETSYMQKILVNHTNHISYSNFEKQVTIELHWRLIKTPVISYNHLDSLVRNNLVSINLAGRSFSVLSNEMELLYLIIHGGIHWWRRLKWIIDINAFLKTQTVNLKKFKELGEELKADHMLAFCNAVLSRYFPGGPQLTDVKPPDSCLVNFSEKRIQSGVELAQDFYQRIVQTVYFSLTFFPGIRYKLRTIRNYIFVPEFFGKNKFISWLPLFYIYGPIRLAIERLKR